MVKIKELYTLVNDGKITSEEFINSIKENYKNEVITPKYLGLIFEIYVVYKKWVDEEKRVSRKILISELIEINKSFKTENGCSWARSDNSYLGKKYIINREIKNGKVFSVQLNGINHSFKRNRVINPEIYKIISKQPCAFTGTTNQIEVDHKNGRYDNERVANPKTQTADDFQALTKTVNCIKRQNCKKCTETNLRFDAKKLGYSKGWIFGNEKWEGTCEGCLWYDCKKFREVISNQNTKGE